MASLWHCFSAYYLMLLLSFSQAGLPKENSIRKILVVQSPYGGGHSIFMTEVAQSLASSGNEVTLLGIRSTEPAYQWLIKEGIKDKNLGFQLLSSPELEAYQHELDDIYPQLPVWDTPAQVTHVHFMSPARRLIHLYCEALLADQAQTDKLVAQQYQLVLIDEHMNVCGMTLAATVLRLPYALCLAGPLYPGTAYLLGLPHNPAYVPSAMTGYPSDMSFLQRVKNVFEMIENSYEMSYEFNSYPSEEAMKTISEIPALPTKKLYARASFVFINTHLVLENPRPSMPHVAHIGGLQCKKQPPTLPKDIDNFISGSESGVILVNLGRLVSGISTPPSVIRVLSRVVASLTSYRIIFKYNGPTPIPMLNFTSNVMVVKDINQQGVLAHRKTRLLVTHGSIYSCMDAVCHGVPVIGIPMYMDQVDNVERLVERGIGVKIDKLQLGKRRLTAALNTTLNDTRFTERAKYFSRLVWDAPLTPVAALNYWSGYLIDYNGAQHLRSKTLQELGIIRYLMIDVTLFLITCLTIIMVVFLVVCRRPTKRAHHPDGRRRTRTNSMMRDRTYSEVEPNGATVFDNKKDS